MSPALGAAGVTAAAAALGFNSCAAGAAICRVAQCDKSSELWGFMKNVCAWGEGAVAVGLAGSRLYFLSFVNQASHVLFFQAQRYFHVRKKKKIHFVANQ